MQYNAAAAPRRAGRAHPSAVIGYCQVPRIYASIPTRIYAHAHPHTHSPSRIYVYKYIYILGSERQVTAAVEHWKKKNFFTRPHTHTHQGLLSLPSSAGSLSSVFSKLNRFVFFFFFALYRRRSLSLPLIISLIFFLSFHDSWKSKPPPPAHDKRKSHAISGRWAVTCMN